MKKQLLTLSFFLMLLLTGTSIAQLRAQTGLWNADKTISNYSLAAGGELERTVTLQITFPKPFNTKPEVIFGITRFDADANINERYDVKVTYIHKGGFTLEVKTWGGTKIQLIGGNWMAVGE